MHVTMKQSRRGEVTTLYRPKVELQLERMLHSRTLERASRLRGLLQYLIQSVADGSELDEQTIAMEFFGKSQDFDPAVDPAIRVQVGRLRRALDRYYQKEGLGDPVLISIPSRSYTPQIEIRESRSDAKEAPEKVGDPVPETIDSSDDDNSGSDAVCNALVVLPFSNLTNEEDHGVFCYGLTEEIATLIAKKRSYRVVANNSAFQFKDSSVDVREVGQELCAEFVLEGSVRMEEGRARVTAQLARTEDGVSVWSSTFDGKINGSLSTQSALAKKVADKIPDASQLEGKE